MLAADRTAALVVFAVFLRAVGQPQLVLVDSPAFILRTQAFDYTPRRPVPVFHPYSLDQVRRSIHRPAQVL
jgi:hypothetical protein